MPHQQLQDPLPRVAQGRPVAVPGAPVVAQGIALSDMGAVAGGARPSDGPYSNAVNEELMAALEQLVALHAAGHVTLAEFEAAKARLLGLPPPLEPGAVPVATAVAVPVQTV